MIRAYRLCRAVYADLTGIGAALVGGRWNPVGAPVVYAARDAALAVLEVRVHLDLPLELVPDDYLLVTIEGEGDGVERIDGMPEDPETFGARWIAEGRTAALDVPSAIVPESRNLLLNPRHPAAASFRIADRRSFRFDGRLWAGRP